MASSKGSHQGEERGGKLSQMSLSSWPAYMECQSVSFGNPSLVPKSTECYWDVNLILCNPSKAAIGWPIAMSCLRQTMSVHMRHAPSQMFF